MGQGLGPRSPEPTSGFDDFFRENEVRLLIFLWRLGADPEEARDILQTVMMEVYLRWDDIDHPKAYARKVAEHEFLRSKAEISKQRRAESAALTTDYVDPMVLAEEAQQVLAVLRSLPPAQRRVMAWYLDGFSPAEIAIRTNQKVSTVRSNLRHARKALAPLYLRQRATQTSAGRRLDDGREVG